MSPGRKALVIILFIVLLAVVFGGGEKATQPDKIATPLQQVSAAEPTATVKDKETARAAYSANQYVSVIVQQPTAAPAYAGVSMRRGEAQPTATPAPALQTMRRIENPEEPEEPEIYVWIPKSGKKYHSKSSCSNMSKTAMVTLEEAKSMGYDPCKKCKPPK